MTRAPGRSTNPGSTETMRSALMTIETWERGAFEIPSRSFPACTTMSSADAYGTWSMQRSPNARHAAGRELRLCVFFFKRLPPSGFRSSDCNLRRAGGRTKPISGLWKHKAIFELASRERVLGYEVADCGEIAPIAPDRPRGLQ